MTATASGSDLAATAAAAAIATAGGTIGGIDAGTDIASASTTVADEAAATTAGSAASEVVATGTTMTAHAAPTAEGTAVTAVRLVIRKRHVFQGERTVVQKHTAAQARATTASGAALSYAVLNREVFQYHRAALDKQRAVAVSIYGSNAAARNGDVAVDKMQRVPAKMGACRQAEGIGSTAAARVATTDQTVGIGRGNCVFQGARGTVHGNHRGLRGSSGQDAGDGQE